MTVLPYGHKYKKSTGYAVFSNTSLHSFFCLLHLSLYRSYKVVLVVA